MINWKNYEEYLMLYVDKELDEEKQNELLGFMNAHPELQAELKMFQSATLTPDATKVYANKENLLKPLPQRKFIALSGWWAYGAAASVILIILFVATRWMSNNDKMEMKHEIATTNLPTTTTNNPKISNNLQQQSNNTPTTSNNLQQSPTKTVQPMIRREESISIAKRSVRSNTNGLVKENASSKMAEIETIQPLTYEMDQSAIVNLPTSAFPIPVANETNIIKQEKTQTDLLAWLPEEKKQGLQTLKQNIDQKIEKAKTIKNNLKDTQLALKIGNRELLVFNF